MAWYFGSMLFCEKCAEKKKPFRRQCCSWCLCRYSNINSADNGNNAGGGSPGPSVSPVALGDRDEDLERDSPIAGGMGKRGQEAGRPKDGRAFRSPTLYFSY